jgi:hypothetical protein
MAIGLHQQVRSAIQWYLLLRCITNKFTCWTPTIRFAYRSKIKVNEEGKYGLDVITTGDGK